MLSRGDSALGSRTDTGYERPAVVRDYGDLREITASTAQCGVEDGAAKTAAQHHTQPCA